MSSNCTSLYSPYIFPNNKYLIIPFIYYLRKNIFSLYIICTHDIIDGSRRSISSSVPELLVWQSIINEGFSFSQWKPSIVLSSEFLLSLYKYILTFELIAPCYRAFLFNSLKLRSAFWSLVWSWKAQLEVTTRINTNNNKSNLIVPPLCLFSMPTHMWSYFGEGCNGTVSLFPHRLY